MAQLDQVVCNQAQVPAAVAVGTALLAGQSGDVRFDMRGDLSRLTGAWPVEQGLLHMALTVVVALDGVGDGILRAAKLCGHKLLIEQPLVEQQ